MRAAFEIRFQYPLMNDVMRVLKQFDANILGQEMNLDVTMKLEIRQDRLLQIRRQLLLVKSLTFSAL
jgi:putative IMPACT (imprinted ancient) family translation regulator